MELMQSGKHNKKMPASTCFEKGSLLIAKTKESTAIVNHTIIAGKTERALKGAKNTANEGL